MPESVPAPDAEATQDTPEVPEPSGTPEVPETPQAPETGEPSPTEKPPISAPEAGAPPETPEPAASLAESPETLRVTWEDGTTSDVPVQELVAGYQLAVRARDDLKAAQEISTAAQEVVQGLIQNPFGVLLDAFAGAMGDREKALEEVGRQVTEFADAWKQMKGLPPAEQELLRLRREHAAIKAENERLKQKEVQGKEAQEVAADTQRALKDIHGALKAAGLPERPVLVKAVARELLDAHQSKEKLSTAQAVARVKKQLQTELEERLKALGDDPKAFEGLYPKVTELVRKRDLNGVKTAQSARVQAKPGRTPEKESKPLILRNNNWSELFGG